MARKANTTEAPAQETRPPTFDINDPVFQAIVAQAVAAAMSQQKAQERSSDTDKRNQSIVKAFQKAGYADVVLLDPNKPLASQPDVSLLTFAKWMEVGRRVKEGEHALKIRGCNLRLYHKAQTRLATTEERKAYFKSRQEKAARREAKAGEGAQPQPQA